MERGKCWYTVVSTLNGEDVYLRSLNNRGLYWKCEPVERQHYKPVALTWSQACKVQSEVHKKHKPRIVGLPF